MGNFSKDPGVALGEALDNHYLGVHIEQGVPLLDRDLNLMHDLLASAIRTGLREYVGDGVALADEHAFAIVSGGGADDFIIRAGDQIPGRLLVGGVQVSIDRDRWYREQNPDPMPDLGAGPRADTAYLDAWIEEIDDRADGTLVNPGDVGMRTSVREQSKWMVRVVAGTTVPGPDAGHIHVPLAILRRTHDGSMEVVRDLRVTRLNLADLLTRASRCSAPSFTAPGSQVRPTIAIAGTRLILSGRNLDLPDGCEVTFAPATGAGTGPRGRATSRPAEAPGEAFVEVPGNGLRGDHAILVHGPFGSAVSDDHVTILAAPEPLLPSAPGMEVTPCAVNNNGQVVGVCGEKLVIWERDPSARSWRVVVTLGEYRENARPGIDDVGDVIGAQGSNLLVWRIGSPGTSTLPAADGYKEANAISIDGRMIVGMVEEIEVAGSVPNRVAVYWSRDKTGAWQRHPLEWSDTTDKWSCATALASGLIVGYATQAPYGISKRSVVWRLEGGRWQPHDVFSHPNTRPASSYATAVNDDGIVVGWYERRTSAGSTLDQGTFIWDSGRDNLLAMLPNLLPAGISSRGHVIATSITDGPAFFAPVAWDRRGGLVGLAAPGLVATADNVNARGDVIGRHCATSEMEAVIWART